MANKESSFHFQKIVDIQIPQSELEQLLNDGVCHADHPQGVVRTSDNASLNRAVYWITTTDCANITAWRSGNKRAINDANNRELQETLVFDLNDDPNFYENLYKLSEKFDQDCFLYKAAEEDIAYLIGTNEDFIRDNGERVEAGRLRIGNLSANTYSEIGSGRISFE